MSGKLDFQWICPCRQISNTARPCYNCGGETYGYIFIDDLLDEINRMILKHKEAKEKQTRIAGIGIHGAIHNHKISAYESLKKTIVEEMCLTNEKGN